MSSQRLFKRIHAAHIQMNAGIIRPNIYEHDYRILMDSLDEVGQLPILIDEFTSSISGARAQFKEGKQRRKMVACFVDYLQLMKSANKQGNRQQEVSDIARGLKDAARDYNMPIIALSQLSRKNMQEDRAPELSDLRESGEIEQAARTVIFLHGEKIKVEAGQPYPRIRHMECIIAKQGDGPLGSFPLRLDSPYLTFHTPMLDEAWARVRHTTVEEIDAERGPDGLESEDDSEWSVN
jgi:replicative DNA helicase